MAFPLLGGQFLKGGTYVYLEGPMQHVCVCLALSLPLSVSREAFVFIPAPEGSSGPKQVSSPAQSSPTGLCVDGLQRGCQHWSATACFENISETVSRNSHFGGALLH